MASADNFTTLAKLRFAAEVAIAALEAPGTDTSRRFRMGAEIIPETASEEMLRTLLTHAIPVLKAAGRSDLAEAIRKTLDDRAA